MNTCKSLCPFVLNCSQIVFFLPDGLQTLAIRNIIGVGITCPVILITGRGSLCPFSYTCIFVRPDGQPCVEAQHYTTIVPDSLFFTWWIANFVRPDGQPCVEAQEFGLVRNMLIAVVEERYKDAGNDPFVLCIHSVHRGLHIECLTMIPPSVVLSKLSECWTNITSLLLCNHVLQRNKTHWSWRNTLILKSNYH